MSKAGLDIMTECLRYELQQQGVSVVLIKPGPVRTPIWDKSRGRSEAIVKQLPPPAQELYGRALTKVVVKVTLSQGFRVDNDVRHACMFASP